jgi:hypothetical protein
MVGGRGVTVNLCDEPERGAIKGEIDFSKFITIHRNSESVNGSVTLLLWYDAGLDLEDLAVLLACPKRHTFETFAPARGQMLVRISQHVRGHPNVSQILKGLARHAGISLRWGTT